MSKNNSKKNTAIMLSKNADVPQVLEVLKKKLASLKEIVDTPYKTQGNLEGFGDIKVETKIENLIRAYSSVKGREKAYHDAAKDLGKTTYPAFVVSGGDADAWKSDIMLRIAIIEQKETHDKLSNWESKMKNFLSAEEQKELLIKEMTEDLNL